MGMHAPPRETRCGVGGVGEVRDGSTRERSMSKTIDPSLEAHLGKPVWCVYGPDCFPSVICCKILDHPHDGLSIWGYSIYRRSAGFRTLGKNLDTWMDDNTNVKFYEFLDDALDALRVLLTPRRIK